MQADPFHEHLDACEQCRDQPFNLCETGAKALDDSMKKIDEELTRTARTPPYMLRLPRWP